LGLFPSDPTRKRAGYSSAQNYLQEQKLRFWLPPLNTVELRDFPTDRKEHEYTFYDVFIRVLFHPWGSCSLEKSVCL
jgi:hypothetical protein